MERVKGFTQHLSLQRRGVKSHPCGGQRAGIRKVLIANRGEIAIRIARAASQMGIQSVAVYTSEDARSLHIQTSDEAFKLPVNGPAGYLDAEGLINIALSSGCDSVHPGYGFLSESDSFCTQCEAAGLCFIGPPASALRIFGDKVSSRKLAKRCGIPVIVGTEAVTSVTALEKELSRVDVGFPLLLKASAGGGGKGMRVVREKSELSENFKACSREAVAAFGEGAVFAEKYIENPRHIEVQLLADTQGEVVHLFERDCSVQQRHQKVIEIAPAQGLQQNVLDALYEAGKTLMKATGYIGVGTVEFLLDQEQNFYFIECNPRLQVEHTVTEEITGVDLVEAQFRIATKEPLSSFGVEQKYVVSRGCAIQCRVQALSAGYLRAYKEPSGPGIRVDAHGYLGFSPPLAFDPLLAKVICKAQNFQAATKKAVSALRQFHLEGVDSNIALLLRLLNNEHFASGCPTTRILEFVVRATHGNGNPQGSQSKEVKMLEEMLPKGAEMEREKEKEKEKQKERRLGLDIPAGHAVVASPLQGQIVQVLVKEGDVVLQGSTCALVLSMKMEHQIEAQVQGVVVKVSTESGQFVEEGDPLFLVELNEEVAQQASVQSDDVDLDYIRADLAEVLERRRITTDEARKEHDKNFAKRVQRRRKSGMRTARENVLDLCDQGTFVEYGRFRVAAQRSRRTLEDLIHNTPADGIVTGIGCVNADLFGREVTRTAVLAYDYTVLAGTQGFHSHLKTDRLLQVCLKLRLPLVWFCEGGGGRPGDVDAQGGSGLAVPTWAIQGQLSGLVPLVGLVSGYCFAGNAACLGACDVVIATKGCNIGMGGPAMIEGGGLGVFAAKDIGRDDMQFRNGVIDILVETEAEGVAAAKRYLSYFQADLDLEEHRNNCADQRKLRHVVPENRLRVYEMRRLIELLVDTSSVLYLREGFGLGMITALARIGGRSVGVLANNPKFLGGAIDSDAAMKAARFVELCDGFDLPIVCLIDCPGFMVGPESEEEAAVRKMCRMFLVGASITVPYFSIITRKSYGLGAQAMSMGTLMGGATFNVSWPTGELGGMGLEGAVKLGYSKELAKAKESGGVEAEKALYDKLLAASYKNGKAMNNALHGELDDVIDPAETREYILAGLEANPAPPKNREKKKRPLISSW